VTPAGLLLDEMAPGVQVEELERKTGVAFTRKA
jgi:acyl CoA:acetate/3-ketoacid CoA transferase beta subunit